MEDFNVSQRELLTQFLSYNYNKDSLKCDVLFPDGTVINDATIYIKTGAEILLVITIHGIEFQDWVGLGMSRFKDLKYKILEKRPNKSQK